MSNYFSNLAERTENMQIRQMGTELQLHAVDYFVLVIFDLSQPGCRLAQIKE